MRVLLKELASIDSEVTESVNKMYSKLIFKDFSVVNDTKNPLKTSYTSEGVSVSLGADYSLVDEDTVTSEGVLCINSILVYLNRKSQIMSWYQCGIISKMEFSKALRDLIDNTINILAMIFGITSKLNKDTVAHVGQEVKAGGFSNRDEEDLNSVCKPVQSSDLDDDGTL